MRIENLMLICGWLALGVHFFISEIEIATILSGFALASFVYSLLIQLELIKNDG